MIKYVHIIYTYIHSVYIASKNIYVFIFTHQIWFIFMTIIIVYIALIQMQTIYAFINIDVYRKRNYTYIYCEPAVYIREYIKYIIEYTVSYCSWIKKRPNIFQLRRAGNSSAMFDGVLINAVAIEAHREHRSLHSLSSRASADCTWKSFRGNKSCCQAMTPNTSAKWGP